MRSNVKKEFLLYLLHHFLYNAYIAPEIQYAMLPSNFVPAAIPTWSIRPSKITTYLKEENNLPRSDLG